MLRTSEVDAIKTLAAAGFSQRVIAKRVGVSRGSVFNVLTGRHCSATEGGGFLRVPEPDFDQPQERCTECGVMVYPPCIACWVRGLVRTGRIARVVYCTTPKDQNGGNGENG